MNTISHPYVARTQVSSVSVVDRFFAWCAAQDRNRYGWLAVIVTVHATVLAPLAFITVLATGMSFMYIPFIIGGMTACVVSNLAAMSTKATIPIFLVSVLIDLLIVAIGIAGLF